MSLSSFVSALVGSRREQITKGREEGQGGGCPQGCTGACEESVDLLLLEHVELAQLVRTGVRVMSGTRSGCSAARQLAWQGTCRPMLKPMQLKALAVATSSLHTACERDRSSGRRTASSEMCRPGVRRVVSRAMPKSRETPEDRVGVGRVLKGDKPTTTPTTPLAAIR